MHPPVDFFAEATEMEEVLPNRKIISALQFRGVHIISEGAIEAIQKQLKR